MLKSDKSAALTREFNKYYPGGHSNFHVPLIATDHRLFIRKAKGSRIWDVDGNEYIEFNGAMGPSFIGHGHPKWTAALVDCLQTFTTHIGSNLCFSEDDVAIGEMLTRFIPCGERFKFCITGSDAVQLIIRLARAHTGKPRYVCFENHYHGWFDNVPGGHLNPDKTAKPAPVDVEGLSNDDAWADSRGRTPWADEESFMLPWNDFGALEDCFNKYHDEIALIHFEPIVMNHFNFYPKPGFIEKIRELCNKYNVVMSVDEIIGGFRTGLSGIQGLLGIDADICSLGKAISGGVPVSCVGGKRKIMEQLGRDKVLAPGTYNGWIFGQRAVRANLEILSADNGAVYKQVQQVQDIIMNDFLAAAERNGIPATLTHAPGIFATLFGVPGGKRTLYVEDEAKGYRSDVTFRFQALMQQNGVLLLLGNRWYMSAAHTMEDAKKVKEALDKSMPGLKAMF